MRLDITCLSDVRPMQAMTQMECPSEYVHLFVKGPKLHCTPPVLQEVAVGLAVLGTAMPANTKQDVLLDAYIALCSDRVWAVRKACAEILPEIAKLAPAEMRQTQLLSVFDQFCEDVSHWVQNSALQQLGPFVTTLEKFNIPQSKQATCVCCVYSWRCIA